MTPALKRAIWILNTCGFTFYLAWLATISDKQILREQDGIIYFLPVIPFFFVYMLMIDPKKPSAPDTGAGSQGQPSHDNGHDAH
jgi:hypothetical protein